MKTDIIKKNKEELIFTIQDEDVSFVNAIRRTCIMEVPTMAIERVEIYKNDSNLFDEVLAHRLGLLPLTTNLESFVFPDECDCEDHCPKCSVSFVIREKGPKVIYSKDLNPTDPQIKPVHENIPLVKLEENQEIELEAIAQLGVGLEHAKWQPTTACAYKYYPLITIDETCEACRKCEEECPRGILKLDEAKSKMTVVDLEECRMCKTCMKVCEVGAIDVGTQEGKFIFKIETDGSLPPEGVLMRACDVLSKKSEKIITFCKGGS